MKKIFISTIAISVLFFTVGCNTDFDTDVKDVVVSAGSADFTKYLALGNSLTSGYRDNALYLDGQNESYPKMIATQMMRAGGGVFNQPLMPNNTGGFTNLPGFPGKFILSVVNGSLSPVSTAAAGTLDNISAAGPYQNMGVPGAKSFHLGAAGYGNTAGLATGTANPYFVRFASTANTSVIADALAQAPTFFSLWIGNNDVLSYATSGGIGTDQKGNTNPLTYGPNDITDPGVLGSAISGYVNALTANGAKGVVANIPNVTSIPYFTTVPAMPIPGAPSTVSQLNAGYAQYNGGLAQAKNGGLITDAEYQQRLIKFTVGVANGAVIIDKDLTNLSASGIPSYRQTTAKDYILLPASTVLTPTAGGGTSVPLDDQFVLTEKETAKVMAATAAYNTAIKSIADSKNLAFVDASKKMNELAGASGIQYNGVTYNTTFVTGGTFSLDGVHLTGRGYALIANEFMKMINEKYSSTLPMVNVNNYSGVTFP
jgi:lysophospholipase L1-like esterase